MTIPDGATDVRFAWVMSDVLDVAFRIPRDGGMVEHLFLKVPPAFAERVLEVWAG